MWHLESMQTAEHSGSKSLLRSQAATCGYIAYLTFLSVSILMHNIRGSIRGTLRFLMLLGLILEYTITWLTRLAQRYYLKSLFYWQVLNLLDPALSESCGEYSAILCDGPSIMCFFTLKNEVQRMVSTMEEEKNNRMNPDSEAHRKDMSANSQLTYLYKYWAEISNFRKSKTMVPLSKERCEQ